MKKSVIVMVLLVAGDMKARGNPMWMESRENGKAKLEAVEGYRWRLTPEAWAWWEAEKAEYRLRQVEYETERLRMERFKHEAVSIVEGGR